MDFLAANRDLLSIAADIAQAVTGLTAGILGGRYLWRARDRRVRLEEYLKSELERDQHSHTVLHLIAHTAMTEAEVFEAAHASAKIKAMVSKDEETGLADGLFFRYVGK